MKKTKSVLFMEPDETSTKHLVNTFESFLVGVEAYHCPEILLYRIKEGYVRLPNFSGMLLNADNEGTLDKICDLVKYVKRNKYKGSIIVGGDQDLVDEAKLYFPNSISYMVKPLGMEAILDTFGVQKAETVDSIMKRKRSIWPFKTKKRHELDVEDHKQTFRDQYNFARGCLYDENITLAKKHMWKAKASLANLDEAGTNLGYDYINLHNVMNDLQKKITSASIHKRENMHSRTPDFSERAYMNLASKL